MKKGRDDGTDGSKDVANIKGEIALRNWQTRSILIRLEQSESETEKEILLMLMEAKTLQIMERLHCTIGKQDEKWKLKKVKVKMSQIWKIGKLKK